MDKFSHLGNSDVNAIETLYKSYRDNPESVDSSWHSFFQGFGQARKAMPPPGDVMLDPKSILSDYAPEIVVHTIAFESVGSRPLMELIAKQKGGQHRFIAAP